MAKKQVVVCDVCERIDRATKTYRVTSEGRRYTIELCSEHSRPLEAVLARADSKPIRKVTRFEDAITTIDELEARKRARAAAAEDAKSTPASSE